MRRSFISTPPIRSLVVAFVTGATLNWVLKNTDVTDVLRELVRPGMLEKIT